MVTWNHQTEMTKKRANKKTAFSTKEGNWKHERVPFGLQTASATSHRMTNVVLDGLTEWRCFVFLYDTVCAEALADHDNKLRQVMDRLRESKLKFKSEKGEFRRKQVS